MEVKTRELANKKFFTTQFERFISARSSLVQLSCESSRVCVTRSVGGAFVRLFFKFLLPSVKTLAAVNVEEELSKGTRWRRRFLVVFPRRSVRLRQTTRRSSTSSSSPLRRASITCSLKSSPKGETGGWRSFWFSGFVGQSSTGSDSVCCVFFGSSSSILLCLFFIFIIMIFEIVELTGFLNWHSQVLDAVAMVLCGLPGCYLPHAKGWQAVKETQRERMLYCRKHELWTRIWNNFQRVVDRYWYHGIDLDVLIQKFSMFAICSPRLIHEITLKFMLECMWQFQIPTITDFKIVWKNHLMKYYSLVLEFIWSQHGYSNCF